MAQLIDKSALVAEIERRINEINLDSIEDWRYRLQREHDIEVMKNILSLIDTFEVKEVDLEKEWKEFLKDGDVGFKEIAIHFFKLGLQFQTETNITFKYNIGESVRKYKA